MIRNRRQPQQKNDHAVSLRPFWAMVKKEIGDHARSWRAIILLSIVVLTCLGSIYSSLSDLTDAAGSKSADSDFFFLNLFTLSDGTLPSFFVFVSFLGPLLGISLGFDAINSEHSRGTLSRLLAQPVPRDYVLNAKFTAGLIFISFMFFVLTFLVIGAGLIVLGIPPTAEEFLRIILYTVLSILYVAFWLNLAIFFSVRFRQAATAALAGIAVWLFLTLFYPMIVDLVLKGLKPGDYATPQAVYMYQKLKYLMVQIMPSELFSEITSSLLVPSLRSIGPLTMEQLEGAIPGPIPVGQSLQIVWPQLTGLIAMTMLCFLLSYLSFMRREIRSR